MLSKKEKINLLKDNFFGIEGIIDEIYKNFSLSKNDNSEESFTIFLNEINQERLLQLAHRLEEENLVRNKNIAQIIKDFLKNPKVENFITYQQAFFTQSNDARQIYGKASKDLNLLAFIDENRKLISHFLDKINSLKICQNTALLLKFIDQILENYAQIKTQNSFLDYNDLIIETNRLLSNPDFSDWIKHKMDGSFDHILIDESQDTNHLQWNIIKALSEDFFSGLSANNQDRSLFVVGDEKQSIYSFQGAEPNISEEIFSYFNKKADGKLLKVELNNSFRSLSSILEAVDIVFSDENRKKAISKISEFKQHKAIREGLGKVEIWPQIKAEKKEKEEISFAWKVDFSIKENYQEKEKLAEIIAQKIKNDVENKRILKTRKEPLKYSDFMILLRNRTNGFSQALIKFFNKYKIPFSSSNKIKFSKNLLVQDLLSAAKFVLLPQDDLNLACFLKSPFFEISEEDLFEICNVKNINQSNIYEALSDLPKFFEIKKDLDLFIDKSQKLNSFEFFNFLLNFKNSRQKIIAYFGHESLEILNKFTLAVFDFCDNFSPNLQQFLEFSEKLDLEISLLDEGGKGVKIATIHAAKGLQAPVVMIPDCCYNFNQLLASKENISWINIDGQKFPIWCAKKEEENELLKKHRQEKLQEIKDEYLRLLYVAMTRAEDELYIGGFGESSDAESWYEVIKGSLPELLISENEFVVKGESEVFDEIDPVIRRGDNKDKSTSSPDNITSSSSKSASSPDNITSSASSPDRSTFSPVTPSNDGVHFEELGKLKNNKNAPESQINQSQIRGKLIHKILEIFGKNYKEEKSWLLAIAKNLIEKENLLTSKEKLIIAEEIKNFTASNLFDDIFSNGEIRCEVEIAENKNLSRIDLLVIKEKEVLIIDYKSDETLPEKIPQQYLEQLNNYKNLAKNIFLNKKISAAILWVKFLKLDLV